MKDEKLCLKWNYFEENISSAFREFRDNKDFFDVTLACDDEQQIQAHKVILSACSPFFRSVLNRNPHQHPLLYLKGVKYTDLQAVLSFMYQGEVNVAHEELNSFLEVGEDLKVKGLTQYKEDPPSQREPTSFKSQSQKPKKIQKHTSSISQQPTKHPRKAKAQESDILEVTTRKYEPCEIPERNLTATPTKPQAPGACNPPPLVTMAEQKEALVLYQEEEAVVTEVNNNKPDVGNEEHTQVKHKKRKKSKDKDHPKHTTNRIKDKKKKKKSKDGGEIINKESGVAADVTDHQQKKNKSKQPSVTPSAQVDVTDIGDDIENSMDSLPPDQDHSIMSPHRSQTPEQDTSLSYMLPRYSSLSDNSDENII